MSQPAYTLPFIARHGREFLEEPNMAYAEVAAPLSHRQPLPDGDTALPAGDDVWTREVRELAWDYARHGVTPPPEHLAPGHPLRQAWQAARRHLGRRQPATGARAAAVQDWLSLRLDAWQRGKPVQALTVTPNLLRQLQVSRCPVTRESLRRDNGAATRQPVIAPLCATAALAAGHLAMLSRRAAQALTGLTFEELAARARNEAVTASAPAPLTALHWARLAVLRSFATPLPHAQAAALPLVVMPPNRVQVRNPIQALQVLLTLLLARSGWSRQLPAWQALMPDAAARRELQAFFLCLVAKALATKAMAGRPGDEQARRWALEDAWRHPQVLAHWKRFALRLDEAQAQAIVDRALAGGLAPQNVQGHSDEQATAGWWMDDEPRPPGGAVGDVIGTPSHTWCVKPLPVACAAARRAHRAPQQQMTLPMDD